MQRPDLSAAEFPTFLAGGGEMGERTRTFDWSRTALGPVAGWPQSLRSALSICLNSSFPIAIYWGADLALLYNDDWSPIPGTKHPWALGRPAREAWPEIWHIIEPLFGRVLATGEATRSKDQLLPMHRHGFTEECYFDYTFSPIRGESGAVEGVFNAVLETTARVVGERRLRTLRELAAWTTGGDGSEADACRTAARILDGNPHDLPFALIYLVDEGGRRAVLAGQTRLERDTPVSPAAIDLGDPDAPWPLRQAAETGRAVEVADLPSTFGALPGGAWPEPAHRAVVVPLVKPGQTPTGFVVAGVSPRLPFDDEYRGFVDLLAGHVAAAVAGARAYEEEKRRAEALAELDRAKTVFFSNVSHEFRTPLTLLLGPVEGLLARTDDSLSPAVRGELEVVNRNGLRLLRLVNSLLDFSRIEAGRVRAVYQPTDLAALTADLASVFRSACERAGLRLEVDCPPLGEPVFVDPEMWEKVVLNLLSNAFKFTFEGGIAVSVRRSGRAAELRVGDTGTGIPAEEMPRLFERFHRVAGARGRTHEGSGIGLALVQELVKLHGGSVTAESVVGVGTTFTVSVPFGSSHLPADQIGGCRAPGSVANRATPYIEEAFRWLPDAPDAPDASAGLAPDREPVPDSRTTESSAGDRPRVLVADDNADMRQYVTRLLDGAYRVESVPDGAAALAAARDRTPDLILTDVMMPRLDGFGLLKELRADPRTRSVPVIMLSARAGEESRVEGIQAGADDYLVKPFGARELVARVGALVQITRLRRESERAIRLSEERFRVLFETMSEGFAIDEIIFDGSGRGCDLRYLDVNPAFEQHTGLKRADILGRTTLELFPDAEPFWFERYGEVVSTGAPAHFQAQFGPLGRWFEVSAYRTAPGQCAVVFFDITDRKCAERHLAEAHQFLDSTLDALASHIAVLDESGVILAVNEAWRRFGAENRNGDPSYGVGANYLAACEPTIGGCVEAGMVTGLRGVLDGRLPSFEYEYPCHSPTRQRWFVMRATRFRSPGPVRVVVAHEDVTKRKVAEEGLKDADRRKDVFLATLAHELRNPLAPIRNGLQLLRLSGGGGVTGEKARTMMERQLSQMVRLVDDLMDVSRINQGKLELRKERIDLAAVLTSAVETSRPLVEQMGHHLEVVLPTQPVVVEADLTRLAQVFSNLLNNAAKYTERGGRITLTAERRGGDVRVAVRDTGIGIAPDQLPRLFEMFSQVESALERSQGGLGIGLALVKRLVEMHGGRIEARSGGLGQGSEFVVTLPIVEASRPEPEPDNRTSAPKTALRFLVVDDNRDGADSLAEMLKLMGGDICTAYDGEEAVQTATEVRPDVIVLDIGLPKLNGYEVCRRIRALPGSNGVVIIAQTGWGQDEDLQRTHEAGFDHHLIKPVDPTALMTLLAGLSAKR